MTAVLSGEADIGFMGSEATIYTYLGQTQDYVVNFAQLTQRAGNFLVAREPIENFSWDMLKGKKVLGGRAGSLLTTMYRYGEVYGERWGRSVSPLYTGAGMKR